MRLPVVEGIAPELPVLAEIVRRHARDLEGAAPAVEEEELSAGPDVGGILRREYREVPDDKKAGLVRRFLERAPLFREEELKGLVAGDLGRPAAALGGDRGPVAQGERLGPIVVPERAAPMLGLGLRVVLVLYGPEEGVVLEPRALGILEGLELGPARGRSLPQEAIGGAHEELTLPGNDRAVVDAVIGEGGGLPQRPALDKPLLGQDVRADEQLVAREGGKGRVGRVAVARRAERKHLPDALAGSDEEVDEAPGARSQVADAVGTGKRCRMKEYARASPKLHGLIILV